MPQLRDSRSERRLGLVATLLLGVLSWYRLVRQRATNSSRGLTSTIGRYMRPLRSLESPLRGRVLRPSGTAPPGLLLPDGVLFGEARAVLEHLGRPLVDSRQTLGCLEGTSSWRVRRPPARLSVNSH
jgi:hypothetical protein